MHRLVFFLCLLILAGHYTAPAQNIADSAVYTLPGVEIKQERAAKSPAGSALEFIFVNREMLLKSQGNTFINTLEKLAGISAINTGAGIAKPVIRGMSFNRVIVNEYGIKQEGQQWGVDHGLEIDQFNVDQVELIKGPVSVLYGSDGIGGVINILPPAIPATPHIRVDALAQYKSNNDLFGSSVSIQHSSPTQYTLARISYQDYGSYRVPAKTFTYNGYTLPIYGNRLKNTAGNELNFSVLHGIRRKWGTSSFYISQYHQQAGFFTGAFGVPRAYQLTDDEQPRQIGLPRQSIRHSKLIANNKIFLKKGIVEADLAWQHNRRREESQPHAHGNGITPQENLALQLDLHTLSGNFRYTTILQDKWTLVAGISLQHQENSRSGYEFLIPDYRNTQAGIYGFAAYRLRNNITVTGGIRGDIAQQSAPASYVTMYDSSGTAISQQYRSTDINRSYANASASLGLAWNISYHWGLKVNAGTAYRIPSIAELASNGVHHGTFRHELGDSALRSERGYMLDFLLSRKQKTMKMGVSPFLNYFSNYIYLRPSARFSPLPDAGQVYHYTQGQTVFAGLEGNINWEPSPVWETWTAVEYVWNQHIQTRQPLPFTPPFSLLQEITWKHPALHKFVQNFLTFSGHYFAAQNRTDINEPVTAGYFLLHASAGTTWQQQRSRISLYFQIRNLTNTRYLNNMSRYRMLNLPEQGRNIQVILRFQWE